jgi:preprotein translocase subunit SecE
MVNDNRNLINAAHVAAAALAWIAVYMLFELFAGHFSPIARAWSNQTVQHLVPVAAFIIVFAALRFNPASVAFTDDVITELRKVTWPEPKITVGLTWIVCFTLILAGAIVATYDVVWAHIINWIVKG